MARSGGKLLVDCLTALGAVKAFGVPGESYLPVLDALHDSQGQLDFVLCRNEGGAGFMAAAWGKLTGQPGICFVTRGPGATNASIGVHTAMQDSAPMLLFVGQVETGMKGREAFQEVDYRAVFGGLAKWAVEVDHTDRIPEITARAWVTATTGRPGPVVIALPEDVLSGLTDALPLTGPTETAGAEPAAAAVEKARDILGNARRPLIMYGGCNWTGQGRAGFQAFAESSDIPVVAAFRYQDQFDNFSPVFCGEAGVGMPPHVSRLITESDVILAVNNRFGENSTGGYGLLSVPEPRQKIIHVHGSDREIGKIYQPVLGIHAGPDAFAAAIRPVQGDWREWRARARADFEASLIAPDQPSAVDMGKVMAWLQQNLPDDVILTNGAGNFAIWPNKFFKFSGKARLLAPQSGAMGYGLPAAVAARIACPDRVVVCFAGDGDFQMTCAELATAVQADAAPVILLLNNGIYGTIRAHQERHYPGRVFGTTMQNPDFVALAKAYGLYAERVAATNDFAAAFGRAISSKTGALLDLDISPEALTPRQTLTGIRKAALQTG